MRIELRSQELYIMHPALPEAAKCFADKDMLDDALS